MLHGNQSGSKECANCRIRVQGRGMERATHESRQGVGERPR